MIDEATIRTLIGSIGEGEYQQVIGYAIVMLTIAARWFTEGRFSSLVARWVSASSSFLAGIGVALGAGAVWWHALLIGGLASPTSRGFWELVRGLLPARDSRTENP